MTRRNLFIFVEGPDDKRFIERVIEPRIADKIDETNYIEYEEREKEWVKNMIARAASSDSPEELEYIFLTDRNGSKSIEQKKKEIVDDYPEIDKNKIKVVVIEIESWYFAGLTKETCKELEIPYFQDTSDKDKQDFMSKLPDTLYRNKNFKNSFLIKVTTKFCTGEAKKTNDSFERFCDHIGL